MKKKKKERQHYRNTIMVNIKGTNKKCTFKIYNPCDTHVSSRYVQQINLDSQIIIGI